MTQLRRVFLAHAREDKGHVRVLYKRLKQRGFSPWLDEEDLIPGQVWDVEIQKAIHEADAFLACLSKLSVQKQGFVQTEFRLALVAYGERPPGTIYFIPVRLDECEIPDIQIPTRGLRLRDFHWLDLWQEGGFEQLIRALEKEQGSKDGIFHSAHADSRARVATDRMPRPVTPDREADRSPAQGYKPVGILAWLSLLFSLLFSSLISSFYVFGYTYDSRWIDVFFKISFALSLCAIVLFFIYAETRRVAKGYYSIMLIASTVFGLHVLGILFLSVILWITGGEFGGVWKYYFSTLMHVIGL